MRIYRRVMLKLSGEVFGGETGQGLDKDAIHAIAQDVREIAAAGFEVAIVIGGGNFIRGAETAGLAIERATADYMGMMATVMNGLALQSAIEALGYPTRVLSALEIKQVSESYIRRRALRHMEKGRIVILSGGTGNPYFTTDTAAALRATELGCDVLLKATKVDGVYTDDPVKNPDATRYETLSYKEAIEKQLRVMDATAFTVCREHKVPIVVFSLRDPGSILRAAKGQPTGTLVSDEE